MNIENYTRKQLPTVIGCIFCATINTISASDLNTSPQLRIMPLGDSITAGYTDNPQWQHPFEFGYRSGLYNRLKEAGYNFVFVGESDEPFNKKFGDPTHGGTVIPTLDLKKVNQGGHRGYGGWGIQSIQKNISTWIKIDRPNIILLLIGINGMNDDSTKQLELLVKTIFDTDKDVKLIVAQITPGSQYSKRLFDYNTYIRETLVPTYKNKSFPINTVDQYTIFLTDPKDPKSIDVIRLSNGINHPTNQLYDKMAENWFQTVKQMFPNTKEHVGTGK